MFIENSLRNSCGKSIWYAMNLPSRGFYEAEADEAARIAEAQ